MSCRIRYSIVKGVTPARARALVAEAVKALPGSPPVTSQWSDWRSAVKSRRVVVRPFPDALIVADDAWPLAEQLARLLDAPHLELRVQEGDHWDFTLCHRSRVIADFSTRVSYFDEDPSTPRPWKAGSADTFAKLWNIPLRSVSPYFLDWGTLGDPRHVVAGDAFPAGDWQQIFDFMHVLGVDDPFMGADNFQVDMPCWGSVYARQPLWRRAIRRASVWLTGSYPDVPRPARAERERWQKLRASVSIVRVELPDASEDE